LKQFRAEHFSLRHRLVSFLSQRLFRNYTYTIRHGLATGMRRKGGLGFLPIGSAETPETNFLRSLPIEGKVVYDIGAFEGVLTLFFARRARQVVSYEPNPHNYARCLDNVRLNGLKNVEILNRGVSDCAGYVQLIFDPLMPGAGTGENEIARQIGASVKTAQNVRIPTVTLDDDLDLNGLPTPDFIKIDIEGMELPALKGMRRTLSTKRPSLFIEMHGATSKEKVENAHAVIGLLVGFGYRIYDVEGKEYLTLSNLGDRRPSHLYCTQGTDV
jgi:FkbM family methyltransferase